MPFVQNMVKTSGLYGFPS